MKTAKSGYPIGMVVRILVCYTLLCFRSISVEAQHNPLFGAGNSYVNISKQQKGGFIQVGDTLEIRTNYFFGPTYNKTNYTTNGNRYMIWSVRYFDSIPTNTTILNGVNDSLKLITNEGLTFRKYTLAANDDAGSFNATPPIGDYQIQINIGTAPGNPGIANPGNISNSTNASTIIIGTNKPRLFGGMLLTTAFRVVVTGSPGDTITLGAGKLVYKLTNGGADTVVTAKPYRILISSNISSTLCGNGLGPNLASEYKGTFDSGAVQNRVSGPIYAIPSYDYKPLSRTAQTSDGSYSIVNNSSPVGNTNDNSKMQPACAAPATTDSCSNRMHGGFWDIMGDHTGTNDAKGNPAVSNGTKSGYMLMVNADVVTSEAYRQLVTGLCPDTYYEYSAWVKNICKRCGIDSNSNATYKIGVMPNLAFSINDLDIYTSGSLDSLGWIKKGFVFKTGPAQTSATISIRNNASGGGGNDWVIDDIAIGTCGPTTNMNYKPFLLGCQEGVLVELADTIRYSFNPNYSFYKWERSTDGGLTWGPTPLPSSGSATPVLVNGTYQFVTNYPAFVATAADSGHLYRVVLATSNANLSSSSCSFTDGNYVGLRLIDCNNILNQQLSYFTGVLNTANQAVLRWAIPTSNQVRQIELQSSVDGINFRSIYQAIPNTSGLYEYLDADQHNAPVFYRLKIVSTQQLYSTSKTIVLGKQLRFTVQSVVNPFNNLIRCKVVMPKDGWLTTYLFDATGKKIGSRKEWLTKGINQLTMNNFPNLSNGLYLLIFDQDGTFVQKSITRTQ